MNSFSVPVHFFPVGLLALVFVLNMALMPFGALYSLTKTMLYWLILIHHFQNSSESKLDFVL